ncbi:Apolipoprotein N-acyltransferase [Crenothrix polyspora]|uniref:Apolipoprotein N-acyltransferase n=1 Tax=Crenothrix polyspora TaxID=360316 RepID=A0A1R4H243_9GAMM|nr:HupE/UreJ family protein [Crenothrix polyspora]SJM90311.1 Apolipoprotein N-acyltransferase [Crenothrix polyspora]
MKIIILVLLGLISTTALGHKPSDSYLAIEMQDSKISGQWDIALRDLDYAVGLDDNRDNQITWGELQQHQQQVSVYALSHLSINADNQACTTQALEQLVDKHADGAYTVLRFAVVCPVLPKALSFNYKLFFDLDPSHRGLLRLQQSGTTQTAIFSPEQPARTFELGTKSSLREFFEFAKEGVWHIWIGYDHILFLISLLLPAVVWRNNQQWQPVLSFRTAFFDVLKIVTAFTLAHSITLSLATLGLVNLPSRWVESAIAASVLLAALNNIYPMVLTRLWMVAFGFGLIHGLGFASVLTDLGLPENSLIVALLGFNVGVEMGQFAIVSVFLPIAFCVRRTWYYQKLTLGFGSGAIAIIALCWFLDRSLNISSLALLSRMRVNLSSGVPDLLMALNL